MPPTGFAKPNKFLTPADNFDQLQESASSPQGAGFDLAIFFFTTARCAAVDSTGAVRFGGAGLLASACACSLCFASSAEMIQTVMSVPVTKRIKKRKPLETTDERWVLLFANRP